VQGLGRDHNKATVLVITGFVYGTKLDFIIDSGAERSVLPVSAAPQSVIYPSSIKLTGVNGSAIQTYGHCRTEIGIKSLRRQFPIDFIITNTKAILGADFLTLFNLDLNMKRRELSDPLTGIIAKLNPGEFTETTNRIVSSPSNVDFISENYPLVLTAPDYSTAPVNVIKHAISTTGPPLYSKARPLSPVKYQEAKIEFDKLLKLNIVRPSNSPWASPLHMVKKSNGTWRPCGDYRRLNSVTVPDRYSVPNMQTIHHKLRGSCYFTTLDLVKAYHFIPVEEDDISKTAICTPFGNFEYLRMPFGLRNAASTFQRYIDSVFNDFPYVITYIDDILIFSSTEEEHTSHLHAVLEKLSSVGLKINPEKSTLSKPAVSFLGYEINSKGIKPLPERVDALKRLPVPGDKKILQRYIGMFNFYQRCIPQFSEIVMPLRNLMKQSDFNWDSKHDAAFDKLKEAVSLATELSFPDANATFSITADASGHAIGACLHQIVNGVSSPLSFFSRKLSDAEVRYSTFDKELLAVFSALKKWKYMVQDSNLTIFTDHKPLVGAVKSGTERASDRQQRQLSFICEYATDIIHVAGKDNVVADTLSRNPSASIGTVSSFTPAVPKFDLISIAKEQRTCDLDNKYKSFNLVEGVDIKCETSSTNPRPYVPESKRKDVFNFYHSLSHPGRKATTRLIGSRFYWPTMKTDVQLWVAQCCSCQQSKVNRHIKRPISELPCPSQRFTVVHLDLVGPLEIPDSYGNNPKYLLTMIDSYTRWSEVLPLNDISAESVCSAFLFQWVSRFGPPLTLVSDRGSQFNSELMSNLNSCLGINHIRTVSYNPKANGLIERFHRSLKNALRCRGGNWLKQLPFVLLGLRMHPDESGSCPFARVTGEQPLMPRILVDNSDVNQLSQQLQRINFPYTPPRQRATNSYMPDQMKSCDYCWVRVDRVKKSLEAPYQGPYRVLERRPEFFSLQVRGKPVNVSPLRWHDQRQQRTERLRDLWRMQWTERLEEQRWIQRTERLREQSRMQRSERLREQSRIQRSERLSDLWRMQQTERLSDLWRMQQTERSWDLWWTERVDRPQGTQHTEHRKKTKIRQEAAEESDLDKTICLSIIDVPLRKGGHL